MKFNLALNALLLIIAGVISSSAYSATTPNPIVTFDAATTDAVFNVTSKGWSDPAFGNAGWTHSSKWGSFHAEQGQIVSINIRATNVGIHPAATVWYRGASDTAADNYVPDHFYIQNADFFKWGATNESTGEKLGNIVMEHIVHGYDLDNNTAAIKKLNGKLDKIAGRLVLNVRIPYTGDYMFVVGAFNPDSTVDTTKKYDLKVRVKTVQ